MRFQMKISTLVATAAGVVTVMMVGLMAAAITRMNSLTAEVDTMAQDRMPRVAESARALEVLLHASRLLRDALLAEAADVPAKLQEVAANRTGIAAIVAPLEKTAAGDAEASLFRSLAQARAQYEPLEAEFIGAVAGGDKGRARALLVGRLQEAQGAYIAAMGAVSRHQSTQAQKEALAVHATQERANRIMVVMTVIAAAIAAIATVLIVRGLRGMFGANAYAPRMAHAIASGDLTQRIAESRGDDAALLDAMRRMRDQLVTAVAAIRRSAEHVGTASQQIAAGNADLAGRTEEQASSLEETAASMEQLASTVRQNAENAAHANELAQNASRRAEQGGKEVSEVVATMGDISQSAARIGDIIGVIDGIAFQTNILALNAAVEAARAGEQGRGFAVVASEVRSLAHRSSEAAKEIKQLIGSSVERVEVGTKLVERAGGTIQALVGDVKEVGTLMRAIAESTAEQSRGVQQVNKTITEMDKVVQQNASAVQESAAAAESMRTQAETLLAAVSAFRLDSEEESASLAPLRQAPAPRPAPRAQQRAATSTKALVATAMASAAVTAARAEKDEWEEF